MTPVWWVDGAASQDGHARISLEDPGLQSGMSVFETLRTRDHKPVQLHAHLARLAQSAAWLGIPLPSGLAGELEALAEAVPWEAKLNVYLTAGGHRLLKAEPLDGARFGRPVRCALRPALLTPDLPGFVKHTSRAAWELAARRAGVDEVIWVDAGVMLEANRSNVVAVRGGALWTAPLDGRILEGVTRGVVLRIARALGVEVVEEAPPVDVGGGARGEGWEELYLTSTLKGLAPVVALDGAARPGPGPIGRAIGERLRAEMLSGLDMTRE